MIPNERQPLNQHPTELGDLFEAARKVFKPKTLKLKLDDISAEVLLAPNGQGGVDICSVKDLLDEYRTAPERRKGTIVVDDLPSFVFLVNRDKDMDSVIFARLDPKKPRLTAILDFHYAADEDVSAPRFCEDRIRYDFPLSDEWKTWTEHNGKEHSMSQEEFARFLEDHIFDIGEPGGAGAITQAFAVKLGVQLAGPQRLMEVSRGLELRINSTVRNVVNIASGEAQLHYDTAHEGAGNAPLAVPAAFHLHIPIFKGGPLYSIPARLRYRANNGRVTWFYELHRADLFLLDAINESIALVRKAAATADSTEPGGCGLPVIVGTPPKTRNNDD